MQFGSIPNNLSHGSCYHCHLPLDEEVGSFVLTNDAVEGVEAVSRWSRFVVGVVGKLVDNFDLLVGMEKKQCIL